MTIVDSNGKQMVEYKCNSDGLRVRKVATTTGVTDYTLHGKNLVHLTNGTNSLHFYYDAQNRPAVVEFNWVPYAYVHNLQGDIIAIVDSAGTKVVEYKYDAWGKPLSKTGSMANTLGTLNPFRYRGYVYDEETELHYLHFRYYASYINRYLSPDNSGVLGVNLLTRADKNIYAYCDNNPTIRTDEGGEFWNFVIGGIVGGIIGGVSAAISSYMETGEVDVGAVLLGAAVGAVGGVVGATGWNQWVQATAAGALNVANSCIDAAIHGEGVTVEGLATDFTIGFASSLVGSRVTKKAANSANKNINKGISRLARNQYSKGKYYKGATKRAMTMIGNGVKALNTAQGTASVVGSAVGGAASTGKSFILIALAK